MFHHLGLCNSSKLHSVALPWLVIALNLSRVSLLVASDLMEGVTDTLFGTKYFTQGAHLQLPRKVPLRIEPKSYFGELHRLLATASIWTCLRLKVRSVKSFHLQTLYHKQNFRS